jgi:hypothetical protein
MDFAEAQFMAAISADYPVLSLGISVEKGLEKLPWPRADDPRNMQRATWDWQNFLKCSTEVLEIDVPNCSRKLGRPLTLRLICIPWQAGQRSSLREVQTFAYSDGAWYERHVGQVDPSAIAARLKEFDTRHGQWLNVHCVCDLAVSDIPGLDAAGVAGMLLAFASIRARIRNSPRKAARR